MPLLEPITFVSAPMRQAAATPVITDKAENLTSCSFLKSFEAGSMTQCLQPLVTPTGIHSLSKSDPPTPPRGPPPTPRRRAHNELSRAYPPTPPRGPPPTPGDGDIFNSLSLCEPPSPPNGPPPTPQKHKADIFDSLSRRDPPTPPGGPPPTPGHREDYDLFNSLSRRDPPTPPRGPPPSPCRRDIFNELSRCDPPTPPRGPPPSPRDCDDGHYSDLSRSSPPSPPPGPPPTPRRRSSKYDAWTPEETALLISVCRSGVELGWYQIAGLFHGKDGDVCRRKYREIQLSEQPLLNDCDNKSYESLLPTDEVPGLSRGPSPVGSPRLTIDFDSDVECAVDYGMKTIAHLSDELNSALEKEWDNVKGRVQNQHAFSTYSTGIWTMGPSFLEMAELQ
ncbi:uncharacterized protein LAJ45_04759 [Morchella importuna]|uniref:Myb-like domain-containing protein n=1 Tax=Morchella conica CCBAS932 TaxID=1392247 RepID=A0A3N4KD75_9PEZI|nr:uncharacterized protein LAJ45_04759 [Morchella importuna]KAH8151057.1 hypothetical protein LAJ45_04759 [Morchella importuna]RPB08474.1 hypothetical protein P167DRAFT_608729 [Morchella conica CCBAS932]